MPGYTPAFEFSTCETHETLDLYPSKTRTPLLSVTISTFRPSQARTTLGLQLQLQIIPTLTATLLDDISTLPSIFPGTMAHYFTIYTLLHQQSVDSYSGLLSLDRFCRFRKTRKLENLKTSIQCSLICKTSQKEAQTYGDQRNN